MSRPLRSRILLGALVALLLLLAALPVGFHFAVARLKSEVESALGERSTVGAIEVGWNALTLHDVAVRSAPDWPVPEELRARSIRVSPSLLSLFSHDIVIHEVALDAAYLSMLRTRKGNLRVLPAVLEAPHDEADENSQSAPAAAARRITIEAISLADSALDYCDASVARKPHCIALRALNGRFTSLALPALDAHSDLHLDGSVEGPQRKGSLSLDGDITLATRDLDLTLKLAGVDLHTVEPYLIKAAETGVRRGTLDLNIHAKVARRKLNAPGQLTLSDLELAEHGNSFLGMPRSLVISSLKDRDGRVRVDFSLQGNLDDPKFSLNEMMATRVAASVAQGLGISLQGVVGGVGKAAGGIGEGLKKLFGG
ncbi:hypothetical protein GCM10025771_08000 [Niveibacterium umoris]|uniref:DUF748 domain-containing protein n=1 Tax=Niveibacterium umoris TaxID=1193620 RepID=A0A840BLZ1_9RHOO|nr:DUF748 domain-containing protein [Niveibacterium umoris]MBB4013653.1 hypothetical protein [Niveibacterium umoris]